LVAVTLLGSVQRIEDALSWWYPPKLRPDLEILVGVLRDEIAAFALVGHDGPVLRSPVGIADGIEVLKAGVTVDKRGPA